MTFSYKNSKGQTYYLHQRQSQKGGQGRIFFFSKQEGIDTVETLPDKYQIIENLKTGLPIIKKKEIVVT